MLTDDQREAAWLALRSVYGRSSMDADRALTALDKAGFVVLHRDDVTTEYARTNRYTGERQTRGPVLAEERRLVTHWEPITKDDDG